MLFYNSPLARVIFIVCFGLTPFVIMSRAARLRSIPQRELWYAAFFMLIFITLSILVNSTLPKTSGEAVEKVTRHPAFIVPYWLLDSGTFMQPFPVQGFQRSRSGRG
jgi:energy-coupling factor transporter transmembrane protein EcfT